MYNLYRLARLTLARHKACLERGGLILTGPQGARLTRRSLGGPARRRGNPERHGGHNYSGPQAAGPEGDSVEIREKERNIKEGGSYAPLTAYWGAYTHSTRSPTDGLVAILRR